MKTASDPLLKTVEDICAYAQDLGLAIFYGFAVDEEEDIRWNEEHGGDWKKFLDTTKALGAKVLYLNWAPFEEFQVDEALEEVREAVHSSTSEGAEIEQREREIEKYRDKVGLTAVVDLAFALDGVFHIHQIFPQWFLAFEELRPEEEEPEEEPEEKELDKTLVKKWATILANHPQFATCKTYGQRQYLLESLAKDEYETLPVGHVVSRAESIYLLEVRPKDEERLRNEARKLRSQGMTINAIALRLGISKDRVSALVAE